MFFLFLVSNIVEFVKKVIEGGGSKNYFCGICQRYFGRNSTVHCHKRSVHVGLSYQCHICQKSYNRQDNFQSTDNVLLGTSGYTTINV